MGKASAARKVRRVLRGKKKDCTKIQMALWVCSRAGGIGGFDKLKEHMEAHGGKAERLGSSVYGCPCGGTLVNLHAGTAWVNHNPDAPQKLSPDESPTYRLV